MRRCVLFSCPAVVGATSGSPSASPSELSNVLPKPSVAPAVVRSLYRALLKEVRSLDSNPLVKTLFPLTKNIQTFLNVDHALYQPNGASYSAELRKVFRNRKTLADNATVVAAFDTLNRLRYHNKEVVERLHASAKEREQLSAALKAALPKDGQFYAKATERDAATAERPVTPFVAAGDPTVFPLKVVPRKDVSKHRVELKVGQGLIAHPLSSAHGDRRVMIITGKNAHNTTGLVLDMLYSYPLSAGNPMFPEVFWGHEIFNGGYLHVDFTMPPTACVSVLHTLEPPMEVAQGEKSSESQYNAWRKWLHHRDDRSKNAPRMSIAEQHEILCKPLIRGRLRSDGSREPTLYHSKVEALPYLAQLASGQPRSMLRLYWGCMRWATSQITHEVASGHWIPVDLSPSFFAGYPLTPSVAGASKTTDSDKAKAMVFDERFPTLEEIAQAREMRLKHQHVDVVAPQVFPPDQPMCRRETLWDQIVLSLGGEYSALVGAANPFAAKQDGGIRAPPVEIVSEEETNPHFGPGELPLLDESDDDDDDDDD